LVVAVMVGGLYPQCLADPVSTDPRLAELWLNNNSEVRSLLTVARDLPQDMLAIYGFALAALVLALVTMRRDREARGWPWLLMLGVLATQFAISTWLVRASATADLIAVPLIAAALVRLFPVGERGVLGLTRAMLIGALALNQASLTLIGEVSAHAVQAFTH